MEVEERGKEGGGGSRGAPALLDFVKIYESPHCLTHS